MKFYLSVILRKFILLVCMTIVLEGSSMITIDLNLDDVLAVIAFNDGYETEAQDPSLKGPLYLLAWDKENDKIVLRKGEWSVVVEKEKIECLRIEGSGLLTKMVLTRKEAGIIVEEVFRARLEVEIERVEDAVIPLNASGGGQTEGVAKQSTKKCGRKKGSKAKR